MIALNYTVFLALSGHKCKATFTGLTGQPCMLRRSKLGRYFRSLTLGSRGQPALGEASCIPRQHNLTRVVRLLPPTVPERLSTRPIGLTKLSRPRETPSLIADRVASAAAWSEKSP